MTDYRSEAEKFVTQFLDYVYTVDIKDKLNRGTQKMERSAGVQNLVLAAERIFPPRKIGPAIAEANAKVTDADINSASNVVDLRNQFSRKVQEAGAARGLLAKVLEGDAEAIEQAKTFVALENGVDVEIKI